MGILAQHYNQFGGRLNISFEASFDQVSNSKEK